MRLVNILPSGRVFSGIFSCGVLFASGASSQQLSAQDIRLLCSGLGSAIADSPDGEFSFSDKGLRADSIDGTLRVFEGDELLLSTEGFNYSSYNKCIVELASLQSSPATKGVSIPTFRGEIYYTYGNSTEFLGFISENIDRVVFLDVRLDYGFGTEESYLVEEKCNSDVDVWDSGLADQIFSLPIGNQDSEVSELECSDSRISFSGSDFLISSAGPGTHWFDIEGFFYVSDGPGRWPYLKITWTEGDAEMWSQVRNSDP